MRAKYILPFLLFAVPVSANERFSAEFTLGTAKAGAEVNLNGGGTFELETAGKAAIGAKVGYDFLTPPGGTGARFGIDGDLMWHDLSATKTNATLGRVTVKSNWSGSLTARGGYDFGTFYPYASIGLGVTDAAVGTNGRDPDQKLRLGGAVALGLEADIGDGWSGRIEGSAMTTPDFTPRGGGGSAFAGTGVLRIGLIGRF